MSYDNYMSQRKLLSQIIALMFFIFLANAAIVKFHWYYTIWWSDMPIHFLSGFWVGLFFFYVFYTRDIFTQKLAVVVFCVLLIGISWEVFEFLLNIISKESLNTLDTLSDIFFDVSGGLCAILYVCKREQIKLQIRQSA